MQSAPSLAGSRRTATTSGTKRSLPFPNLCFAFFGTINSVLSQSRLANSLMGDVYAMVANDQEVLILLRRLKKTRFLVLMLMLPTTALRA